VLFLPQHFIGLAGMPRRIPDYALQFADFNAISSVAAFVFGFTQLLFVYIVIHTIRKGSPASGQVWEGAVGLEWTLSSPPPHHSFEVPPRID
jgi:cytochrome c oxidase subunit 1